MQYTANFTAVNIDILISRQKVIGVILAYPFNEDEVTIDRARSNMGILHLKACNAIFKLTQDLITVLVLRSDKVESAIVLTMFPQI